MGHQITFTIPAPCSCCGSGLITGPLYLRPMASGRYDSLAAAQFALAHYVSGCKVFCPSDAGMTGNPASAPPGAVGNTDLAVVETSTELQIDKTYTMLMGVPPAPVAIEVGTTLYFALTVGQAGTLSMDFTVSCSAPRTIYGGANDAVRLHLYTTGYSEIGSPAQNLINGDTSGTLNKAIPAAGTYIVKITMERRINAADAPASITGAFDLDISASTWGTVAVIGQAVALYDDGAGGTGQEACV